MNIQLTLSSSICKNFYKEVFITTVSYYILWVFVSQRQNGIIYPAICPIELTTGTQSMIH